jgi:purine-binding chemotaxis protein CheW
VSGQKKRGDSKGGGKGGGRNRGAGAAVPRPKETRQPLPAPDDRVLLFADSLQAERVEDEQERHEWETWVTCRVDREVFALPVAHVQEILRVSALTRVPHSPFPVRGVTNLRGYVLPVVDLRLRLGMPAVEPGPQSRVMVVQSRNRLIGLLVDAVEQVTQVDRLAIEPPPEDVMTEHSYYLVGVYHASEQDLVILLDADKVMQVRD